MQRRHPRAGPENGRGGRRALPPAAWPGQAAFSALLRADRFDLVHIWGTEYPAARALHAAALAAGVPALVGIQGVMADCAAHLCDGVPENTAARAVVQRGIDRIVPGALLDGLQARFDALAAGEAALLREARFVTRPHRVRQSRRSPPGPPRALFCVQRDAAPPPFTKAPPGGRARSAPRRGC